MSLVAAYIVPHPPLAVPAVGLGQEKAIQATLDGYEEVAARIAAHAPETIVIISPHTAYYPFWIYLAGGSKAEGDLRQFNAPNVHITLEYDVEFRTELEDMAKEKIIPTGVSDTVAKPLDHGMMVPLYYLDQVYPSNRYKAVSIGGSGLPRDILMQFGSCIAAVAKASHKRCVLLVSGDLSHKLKEDGPYGFHPAGPEFDRQFKKIVESGNTNAFTEISLDLCDDAAECGLSGFVMMAGALDRMRKEGDTFSSELISYEGPFGVGYGVAAFEKLPAASAVSTDEICGIDVSEHAAEDAQEPTYSEDALVDLAYRTVNQYVRMGRVPDTPQLEGDLDRPAACFVSIHTKSTDELRGCIGTIEPMCSTLAEEVIRNAVSASTRDPRFLPIDASELSDLSINVDVLFPPEPARLEELDAKRYGVIVSQGFKRGLLLPDLEGVDTPEQQISIACAKAGIGHFGPDVELERFEVVRHT